MASYNGNVDDLIKQYDKIMGSSSDRQDDTGGMPQIEYFSTYEKSNYETHSYSNLNNFNL